MSDKPILTASAGAPIANNQYLMTAGRRSPWYLRDYQRLPERTLPPQCRGALGTLTITHDLSSSS